MCMQCLQFARKLFGIVGKPWQSQSTYGSWFRYRTHKQGPHPRQTCPSKVWRRFRSAKHPNPSHHRVHWGTRAQYLPRSALMNCVLKAAGPLLMSSTTNAWSFWTRALPLREKCECFKQRQLLMYIFVCMLRTSMQLHIYLEVRAPSGGNSDDEQKKGHFAHACVCACPCTSEIRHGIMTSKA